MKTKYKYRDLPQSLRAVLEGRACTWVAPTFIPKWMRRTELIERNGIDWTKLLGR